uniref:JAB1/MPN/MOV34 metalloenzyme domain-containing protein n=1 Tax=Oryza meridionalis TaxID=40149 RepID=A0A0E0EZP4_9ORYZ
MPPHEDALDAGAGNVLTFRLHPLAVLKLSDRIREFHLHDHQMCGCVIGVRRGETVDVSDIFLHDDPDPGTFDRALLEKDQEIYKKAFPDLSVLGWYSIGTNVHATDMGIHHGDYTDMQIHQTLMDADGTAFYLLLNPAINFSQKDIPVTIYERGVERISLDHADFVYPSPCVVFDVLVPPLGKEKNAFRTMLFETPSGFAMFCVSDVLFRYPEDIWSSFTDPRTAHQVVRTIGFIEVGDKSVVWNKDIGPGEDLEQFILKFPIIKSLNIGCWSNGRIVPELIWGLNYALDEFVPREKGNLSNECHFPLSKQLHEQLKAFEFSISPQLINREFITSFGYLNYLEHTSKNISGDLHQKFDRFFCGLEMSERVFVKVVADRLRSMEEVASTPDRREALSNAKFLLTVPKKKYNTLSCLKRMEAEVRGSGLGHPWVCVAVFAVAFRAMEGLRIAMKRAN